jgi:hypothetical protein
VSRTGIPKRFQLLGHVIQVRILPRSKWRHGKGVVGMWEPEKLRIDLLSNPIDTQLQTVFTHELVHAMLDHMSHELSHDEVFVDQLGHLLQQALTTFEE